MPRGRGPEELAIPTPFVPQSVPHTDKSPLLPAFFNRTGRKFLADGDAVSDSSSWRNFLHDSLVRDGVSLMRKNSRPMRLECLEGRSLMAGDVLAAIKLGSLKMEGDSQANNVSVVDLGAGKVEITGQNGTTINGTTKVTLNGFLSNFKADLKGGDDTISWRGIESHTVSRFSIETGAGIDSVSVDQLFAGSGEIESGEGNDLVEVLNAKASSLEIDAGAGDDIVRVGRSTGAAISVAVSEMEIETGSGNDQVQIQNANLNATSLEIDLGSGDDKAMVGKVTGTSSLEISAGFGTDAVVVVDSTFRTMNIDMGAGDGDDLKLSGVKSTKTKLSGGLGVADKLTITTSDLGALQRSGFEIQ